MKRFLSLSILALFGFFCIFGVSNAQVFWNDEGFPYEDTPVTADLDTISTTEDLGSLAAQGIVKSDDTLLNSFLNMFGF
ncbi:MAG: hypothetical protein LBH96_01840 [Candidatus Peribacteria bacterium]|jgi:hypothetical protein|nr:hypothetical protein [Candidatus Peribacteria bacterium]